MATIFQRKYRYLRDHYLTHKEAMEFARQYPLSGANSLRELPYFQALFRSRRRSVMNYRNAGYTEREIQGALANIYYRNKWLDENYQLDVWKMLKDFRKDSIASGEYNPPKHKGSHHGEGISKGDIEGQRRRRDNRDIEKRKADYKHRIFVINSNIRNKEANESQLAEKARLQKWIKEH